MVAGSNPVRCATSLTQYPANALKPEFELIQIDTAFARKAHIESLKNLKALYVDYMLEKSAADLFSLPEAKIFLACVNHKYSEIEHEMNNSEILVRDQFIYIYESGYIEHSLNHSILNRILPHYKLQ